MSLSLLKHLFAYKAWANQELLQQLASVDPSHSEPLRNSLRLLNHTYVVDSLFKAHLTQTAAPYTATNTKTTPSLAELQQAMQETDAWFIAYLNTLSETDLAYQLEFSFTDGDRGRMSREEILHHLIAHGAYHRGNVGQNLRLIGLAPPRDLFTRFLHQAEPERRN